MHLNVVVRTSQVIVWCRMVCCWSRDKNVTPRLLTFGINPSNRKTSLSKSSNNLRWILNVYISTFHMNEWVTCRMITSMRTGVRSVLLHVSGVQKQTGCQPVHVIYAHPSIPVIPDFPSDIPAVLWNFVYLMSHCVWDLLSTCETRSVPVKGETASCNKPDS